MSRNQTIAVLVAASFLAGCAGNPLTPEQYKQAPSYLQHRDHYSVNANYGQVMSTLKRRAIPCYTGWESERDSRGRYFPHATRYTAKLKHSGNRKATFSIQRYQPSATYAYQVDKDGNFMFVADITREGPKKTGISVYRGLILTGDMADALKAWAQGKTQECPKQLHD